MAGDGEAGGQKRGMGGKVWGGTKCSLKRERRDKGEEGKGWRVGHLSYQLGVGHSSWKLGEECWEQGTGSTLGVRPQRRHAQK